MRRLFLLVSSLLLVTTMAYAEQARTGISIGPTISTLGVGGEVGYRLTNSFGIRGKAQGITPYDGDGTANGINYDYEIKLLTAGVVADYYPLGGGLRLSAGGYYNDNRIEAHNTASSTAIIGGVTTPVAANTVTGDGHYNRFSPYAGVGYDGRLGGGFELGFDLGVLYQGDAKVNAQSSNILIPQADIDEVREDVKDEMNNLRFYPVVGLNLLYRFD